MLHPHQQRAYEQLSRKLRKYNLALLWGMTRSGKTRAFLRVCQDYDNPLVVTKKGAMSGIYSEALEMGGINPLTVINYHSIGKIDDTEYDLIVFDESHLYVTGLPKRSTIWKACKAHTKGADIIFSTATPTAEGYAKLEPMLALSDVSPWKDYPTFNSWFNDGYGRPYTMRLNGYDVNKYDRTNEAYVKRDVKKYVVTITRSAAGHTHEATDKVIHIEQSKKQKKMYKQLKEDLIIEKQEILADTPVKLMMKLHQISGGFVKREDETIYRLKENPKLDWLRDNIDPENTFILAYYQAEQQMLSNYFPHTGSVTKLSSGVDLSMYEHLVIYSMAFSAANYEQVRSRQMNIKRDTPVEVRYLCSGIDLDVYKAVQSKKSFTASWYQKHA